MTHLIHDASPDPQIVHLILVRLKYQQVTFDGVPNLEVPGADPLDT